jgi:hypothetical protein
LKPCNFVPGWTNFNLNNGVRLDITVAKKADIASITVPFLHINHLIQNKKAVNRPKDQLDVIYLEKIKKILEEEEQKNQS